MTDERLEPFVQAWLRSSDPVPPEPLERSAQVMERVHATPQLGRHWPPEVLVGDLEPATDPSATTPAIGSARVRWLPSRFTVIVAALGVVALLLAANLLSRDVGLVQQHGKEPVPGIASPVPTKAVSWITGPVRFEADAIRLQLGDVIVTGQGDATVDGYGDVPGTRELDVYWREHGATQHLDLIATSDGDRWWVSRLLTQDGTEDGNTISFDVAPLGTVAIGEALEGDVRLVGTPDSDSQLPGPVELAIDGLRLRAFEPGTGVDRLTTQIGETAITGDSVGQGALRVVDDGTSHGLENVLDVAVTPDGRSWAATSTHLYELGVEGGLRAIDGGPREISAIEGGADGQLLVSGDQGWLTTDGHIWPVSTVAGSAGLGEAVLAADGALWGFDSTGDGFGRVDDDGLTVYPFEDVSPRAIATDPRAAEREGGIATSADGSVWAAVGSTISRFDGQGWEEHVPLGEPAEGQRVRDVALNDDGTLWALVTDADQDYLVRFDGSGWTRYRWADLIDGLDAALDDGRRRAWGFPEDIGPVLSDGAVIVAPVDEFTDSAHSTLIRFDGQERRVGGFDRFTPEGAAATADGRLWSSGWDGLYLLDPASWTVAAEGTGQADTASAPGMVTLDLRPSRRLEQVVAYLERRTEETDLTIDPAAFLELVREPAEHWREEYPFLQEAPAGGSLEGFLYPGTYEVPVAIGAEDLVHLMLSAWGEHLSPFVSEARAKGIDFYDALILASLVERQASEDSERARIAGVFWNRLDPAVYSGETAGYLQADPSVVYATDSVALEGLEIADWDQYYFWDGLDISDYTSVDVDPEYASFQTYQHKGLPDAPIATPGEASLRAVLEPDTEGGNLYFVSCPGSTTHEFAATLEEHLRNSEHCE